VKYAIKEAGKKGQRDWLVEEVRHQWALNHHAIVKIHDVYVYNDKVCGRRI